jgi:hypothetical protein
MSRLAPRNVAYVQRVVHLPGEGPLGPVRHSTDRRLDTAGPQAFLAAVQRFWRRAPFCRTHWLTEDCPTCCVPSLTLVTLDCDCRDGHELDIRES